MPERFEPELIRGPYNAIHHIEGLDLQIRELRDLRGLLQARFHDNTRRINGGDWSQFDYDLPEFLPLAVTTYPVDITRRGEFVSRHPDQFKHLPSQHDVPGVVKLTLGDLDAAAEWDMLPTLNPDCRKRPQANRTRQLVEDVKYRAIMRRVFVARLLLGAQVWKQATALADQGVSWQDIAARYVVPGNYTKKLTRPTVEGALRHPGMLAERITFTMAARLGSRVAPPFRPFRARAGVDMNEHVDLLLRVEPPDADPTLVGIDITTRTMPEEVWGKYFLQRDSGRSAMSGTLRDPATLERHLAVMRSVLATPDGIDWRYVLQRWSDRRGHTTITPEYTMRADLRSDLGHRILNHVHTPDNQPYYDATVMNKTYMSVYGQWDTEHP
ncbi:MAG: hypothetical protein HY565_04945 [Candidatus Kerfeldbacteria bacterium]|nr:hypothetical protein [Candidatus Kerfeldbacteria bacterium]